MPVDKHKHVPWGGGGVEAGQGRARCIGREHCTVPDQLLVDKEPEFRVKVGKTDTEGGPVMGREHREEAVDRRTVSTTHKQRQSQKSHTNEDTFTAHTQTHIRNVKKTEQDAEERDKQRERERVM